MTSAELREIGEALYGASWQSDLARGLSVSDRTVRRWAAGTHPIGEGVRADLHRLMLSRANRLLDLATRLHNLAA